MKLINLFISFHNIQFTHNLMFILQYHDFDEIFLQLIKTQIKEKNFKNSYTNEKYNLESLFKIIFKRSRKILYIRVLYFTKLIATSWKSLLT